MIKCSICEDNLEEQKHPITGNVFFNKGHNANPVNDGRCCDRCNNTIVIPRRMEIMGMDIDLRQYHMKCIEEFPINKIKEKYNGSK